MFLSELSLEKKKLFLDLGIHAAMANEELAGEEQKMIDAYCMEMNLPQSDYIARSGLDEVLAELNHICTIREKHLIMIEIGALLWSDDVLDETEKQFTERIRVAFEITEKKTNQILEAVIQVKEAYGALSRALEFDC